MIPSNSLRAYIEYLSVFLCVFRPISLRFPDFPDVTCDFSFSVHQSSNSPADQSTRLSSCHHDPFSLEAASDQRDPQGVPHRQSPVFAIVANAEQCGKSQASLCIVPSSLERVFCTNDYMSSVSTKAPFLTTFHNLTTFQMPFIILSNLFTDL